MPVAVYKIDLNYNVKPFINDLMNATGLAFDRDGMLYISSRFDGVVYQVTPNGNMSVYVEGMGVATGMAFDDEGNLYVGDRSGTIFKISPERGRSSSSPRSSRRSRPIIWRSGRTSICTSPVPPRRASIPSTASRTPARWRSSIAAWAGRRAWRSTPRTGCTSPLRSAAAKAWCASTQDRKAELFLSGPGIVGLAFTPVARRWSLATTNALYRVDVGHQGTAARSSDATPKSSQSAPNCSPPQRVDTNSLYLTDQLNALGVEVVTKCVVGDDRERLADAIRRAVSRVARS